MVYFTNAPPIAHPFMEKLNQKCLYLSFRLIYLNLFSDNNYDS